MPDSLRLEVFPKSQLTVFNQLSEQDFINDFYMAGGTCLALNIGHRQSIDFDFFIPSDFDTSAIIYRLSQIGIYERENEERNTINGRFNDVRISFFGYKYVVIDEIKEYGNVRLAGLKDIAAMKLEAISGRGSKKDFIDMYFLLQLFSLDQILEFHSRKYGHGLANRYHHLKSLVYFDDAEDEIMPVMIRPVEWKTVKSLFKNIVKNYKI